uniref:Uncharacterized protein n=1 Tax=Ananas comosus var. bracteatus TaxID=296719 RepID=A0A6V7QDV8_ANACO|nr:unnamed protein product [Ananas comosus var. bracteatus]
MEASSGDSPIAATSEKFPDLEKKESDLEAPITTGGSGRKEVGGMNLSLDETLGSANPHYTRIAREKIAAREAARKAMKARKAAMVEASWCRILQAARIQAKKRRKCWRKLNSMQQKPLKQQELWTRKSQQQLRKHLSGSPIASSSNKEEFKDLLWKISQNPDSNETGEDLTDPQSEVELELKKEAVTEVPSLDKFLVKHVSRLQREVEEARKVKKSDSKSENERSRGSNVTIAECASDLGSVLVKHVSKLEREIQEAKKNIHKDNPRPEGGKCMESNDIEGVNAENEGAESNNVASESTGSCKDRKSTSCWQGIEMLKPILTVFRLEKEKMQRLENVSNFKSQKCEKRQGNEAIPLESLDKILVKHVSRLEKEKWHSGEMMIQLLERKEKRKPHLSRIERDKAAWTRAEEEQMHAMGV